MPDANTMPDATLTHAVLTRPAGRNEALAQKLQDAGWVVATAPALRIETRVLQNGEQPPRLGDFDLVIFVSAPAVTGLMAQYAGVCEWPIQTMAACVGVATARAIHSTFGDSVRIISPQAADLQDSEGLWAVIATLPVRPQRILIVRGQDGRDWLATKLAEEGACVVLHAAYIRELVTWSEQARSTFKDWASASRGAVWLLTSPHGIQAVFDQMESANLLEWGRQCEYVVTHPRLAELVANRLGNPVYSAQIQVVRSDEASILSCFDKYPPPAPPLI